MSNEIVVEAAAARLRAAGLSEPAAQALAGRVVGAIEQLRRQAEGLSPAVEPSTTFAAAPPGAS